MKPTIFNRALNFISTPQKEDFEVHAVELVKAVLSNLYFEGELNEERLQMIVFETHPFEVLELIKGTELASFFESQNERVFGAVLVIVRQKIFPDPEPQAA